MPNVVDPAQGIAEWLSEEAKDQSRDIQQDEAVNNVLHEGPNYDLSARPRNLWFERFLLVVMTMVSGLVGLTLGAGTWVAVASHDWGYAFVYGVPFGFWVWSLPSIFRRD